MKNYLPMFSLLVCQISLACLLVLVVGHCCTYGHLTYIFSVYLPSLRKDLWWHLNPTARWYSFYMIQVIGPVYLWPHVLLDDCWQQVDCTMVLCKATLDRCRYSCPEEFHTHLLDHGTDWGTPSLPVWLYGANCGDCEGAAHCICRYQILHLSLFLHNCHRYRVCGKTLIPIINTDW